VSDFDELVAPFLERRGGKRALAEMLGMTPSGLGRGLQARTLSVENLLVLSKAIGRPASEVLRAAGKHETADLLEELYGAARPQLPAQHAELLALFEGLPLAMRSAALAWMRASGEAVGRPPQDASAKRSAG
jgi:hypothetical protein